MTAGHTILLEQSGRAATRTYRDFDNVSLCVEYLVSFYERKLKQLNPDVGDLSYNIGDILDFLDTYQDIAVLVFAAQTQAYVPHDKDWLKEKIKRHFTQMMSYS